ncbi:hypothetical protein [Nonomuraea sp. NPDC003201]
MGNYGNTLDRWYRRAALVIWPRGQGFASRAEASPDWALDELRTMVHAGEVAKARKAARSLEPFWHTSAGADCQNELLGKALETTEELDDAQTAAMLLRPFRLEQLVPEHAPALAGLAERYGDTWITDLLRDWSEGWRPGPYGLAQAPLEWLADLPRLCTALSAEGSASTTTARRILDLSWAWFAGQVSPTLDGPLTSRQKAWLTTLGAPCSGIIATAAQLRSTGVLDDVHKLSRTAGDRAHVLVLATLRAAGPQRAGFDELAINCAERIRALLRSRNARRMTGRSNCPPDARASCATCSARSSGILNSVPSTGRSRRRSAGMSTPE